jgi:hypothetical protein
MEMITLIIDFSDKAATGIRLQNFRPNLVDSK